MAGIQRAIGGERPGTLFFGLVTIVTAISLEMLVSRTADVVRADGWTLELFLMVLAAGLGFAWLWVGFGTIAVVVELEVEARLLVGLLMAGVGCFVSIQLIEPPRRYGCSG